MTIIMNIKQNTKRLLRAAGEFIYALFYMFSAFSLIYVIVWGTRALMELFDACSTAKDYTTNGILTMVGLYIVCKAYYVLITRKKRRLHAREDALNEEMQRSREVPACPDTFHSSTTGNSDDRQHTPSVNNHQGHIMLPSGCNLPPTQQDERSDNI